MVDGGWGWLLPVLVSGSYTRRAIAMASPHSRSSKSSKEGYHEVLIGRYTRMDHIGKGSFATVYRGVHTVSYSFDSVPPPPTDQPFAFTFFIFY